MQPEFRRQRDWRSGTPPKDDPTGEPGGAQCTSQGNTDTHRSCHCFFLPGNDDRFAVTVPKRLGKAVRRNYAKRRIREFYRLHHHDFPVRGACIIHLSQLPDDWDELFRQITTWIERLPASGD